MTNEQIKSIISPSSGKHLMLMPRLLAAKVGELITYAELSKLLGEDVQTKGKSALRTARHKIRRSDRITFHVQPDVGIFRPTDEQIADRMKDLRHVIKRKAKSTLLESACILKIEALTQEQQTKVHMEQLICSMVIDATSSKSAKAIEKKIATTGKTLSIGWELIESKPS